MEQLSDSVIRKIYQGAYRLFSQAILTPGYRCLGQPSSKPVLSCRLEPRRSLSRVVFVKDQPSLISQNTAAMIVIDPNGDLTIKVIEYMGEMTGEDGNHPVRRVEEFRISRKVLKEKSKVFREMLGNARFGEAAKSAVEIHEDHVESMRIWFLALHGADLMTATNVELEEMWHIVAACGKYLLDITTLKSWFAAWYKKQTIKDEEIHKYLFPCWRFDYAPGFARSSKYLVYNSIRYINEYNPTQYSDLHLPSRVMQQLNAAKGRLRSILFNDLFKPNEKLLIAYCTCKEKTLYNYEKTLYQIQVWPMERTVRHSTMKEILDRLDKFVYVPHREACDSCRYLKIEEIVGKAEIRARGYFEGMCLDCMDRSQPKFGKNVDMDYWYHHTKKEHEWILPMREGAKPCRVKHHQPAWYYSFMGRQQDRDLFAKQADALREDLNSLMDRDFE